MTNKNAESLIPKGLRHRPLDLHVHTPYSYDFQNRGEGPEERRAQLESIIQRAIKTGLHGIAITDHNVVTGIDETKQIAQQYQLTVFPGFEVSCHGSGSGPIHVLGIFDPSWTQAQLERVLGKLEISGVGPDSLSPKSVSDVVDIIRQSEGLPILAHANSTHGALSDIRGNPRISLVQNPSLIAVEATGGDFAKEPGKRLIDHLNGKDASYQRKLAVFSGSDNPASGTGHCAETVGIRYTVFKMGALSLESLRQCFEDPDTRIVQFNDIGTLVNVQPKILEVRIKGGFLDGQSIQFHSGMTSIIGATGTGKSLLIEFLRFVFHRIPHSKLEKEHTTKLAKQLREGGTVTVKFADLSNDEYEVSRTYNAKKPQDSVCKNCSTGQIYGGDTSSIFPILFYSQNEILEVTRDPRAQLNLLDSFRESESRKQKLEGIVSELRELDRRFSTAYESSRDLRGLTKQLRTLDEKIAKCAKQLASKATKEFGEFNELEGLKNTAEERQTCFDEMFGVFEEASQRLTETVSELPEPHDAESPDKEVLTDIHEAFERVTRLLERARSLIETGRERASRSVKSWEKKVKFSRAKKAYDRSLKLQTKLAAIETERRSLQGQREQVRRRMQGATSALQTRAQIRKSRSKLLVKLQLEHDADFAERDVQAKLITLRSGQKLRIQVHKQTDRERYLDNLLELKVKSYAEEGEIEAIVDSIPVFDFVETVLNADAKGLSKSIGVTEGKAENIIGVLLQPDVLQHTLALQHSSFPDDQIQIEYRKQDGAYYQLDELSMGQKADALLMIALGESQMPVVIDQPEDALDLSSIWDDICKCLRVSKSARQFIFTTHNSSVAVASDSDQFIVMNANATQGWVEDSGTIDQQEIKQQIVEHLEGGPDSYDLKRRKYNLGSKKKLAP
jgi:ABC-type lipoprotein export system ATPase subunit